MLFQTDLAAGGSTEETEVEGYLQRISDGILREDRREALAQLRDLLYDNVQVTPTWEELTYCAGSCMV